MNFKLSYGQGEISQSHGSMRCSTICFTLSWWQIRHFESWLCLYLCICICLWIYICICICVCPSQYKLHHSLVVANMTLWKLTPAVIRPWSTLASHAVQIQWILQPFPPHHCHTDCTYLTFLNGVFSYHSIYMYVSSMSFIICTKYFSCYDNCSPKNTQAFSSTLLAHWLFLCDFSPLCIFIWDLLVFLYQTIGLV